MSTLEARIAELEQELADSKANEALLRNGFNVLDSFLAIVPHLLSGRLKKEDMVGVDAEMAEIKRLLAEIRDV